MIHGSIRALKDMGLPMAWSSDGDLVIASGIINVNRKTDRVGVIQKCRNGFYKQMYHFMMLFS